jgi:hypothetical protein
MQSLSLAVAVLVIERMLRAMSSKFPWLPSDNQYVKEAKE